MVIHCFFSNSKFCLFTCCRDCFVYQVQILPKELFHQLLSQKSKHRPSEFILHSLNRGKSIFEMQLFFFIWTFAENFFFCIEERVLAKRKLKKKDKKKTFTNKRSFFLDACQKKNAKK